MNEASDFCHAPATPGGYHDRKSLIEVSNSIWRDRRTHTALDRRMPSVHAAIRDAWYAIFMIPAVVFVLPTGPTWSAMNLSHVRNGARDFGGL